MATMDETEYLLSSEANAEHLRLSIEQAKRGEFTELSLQDICALPKHVKEGIEKAGSKPLKGKPSR